MNMVGSASEAGQLNKSPRASTTTASLSSPIDENQLSTWRASISLIITVTAPDEAGREASSATPYGDETCEMMDRHNSDQRLPDIRRASAAGPTDCAIFGLESDG